MTTKTIEDHQYSSFDVNENNESMRRVFMGDAMAVDRRAKYVEAIYSNSNKTVTYYYYDSSDKNTLYTTITLNYTTAQDTTFTSAEWS